MESNLNRIIKLIQKTGDRLIVTDTSAESPYVIMSFKDYEKILDIPREDVSELSETELLGKINKEIALWRSQQEVKDDEIEEEVAPLWDKSKLKPVVEPEPVKEEPVLNYTPVAPDEKLETSLEKPVISAEKQPGEEDKYYFEPVEN